jgi:hypothetical protein
MSLQPHWNFPSPPKFRMPPAFEGEFAFLSLITQLRRVRVLSTNVDPLGHLWLRARSCLAEFDISYTTPIPVPQQAGPSADQQVEQVLNPTDRELFRSFLSSLESSSACLFDPQIAVAGSKEWPVYDTQGIRDEMEVDVGRRRSGRAPKATTTPTTRRQEDEEMEKGDAEDAGRVGAQGSVKSEDNERGRKKAKTTKDSAATPSSSAPTSRKGRPVRAAAAAAAAAAAQRASSPGDTAGDNTSRSATPPEGDGSPSANYDPEPAQSQSPAGGGTPGRSERRPLLTVAEKRSNHILSEQKRRDAIRLGFKDLVELLQAGEAVSGIHIGVGEDEINAKTGKKKGKGRGRKGEASGGASKSVVLGQGVRYIKWLERGNRALLEELERTESTIAAAGH